MLPDFTRRHRPDIFMARINTGSTKAYLNKSAKCIIDANFVTLWTGGPDSDKHALLALLNSAWTAAALEHSAAVMGGGALKVESSHLRRLPIPRMGSGIITKLASLGKRLSHAKTKKVVSGLLKEIDSAVATAALGREASDDDVKAIRAMAESSRA